MTTTERQGGTLGGTTRGRVCSVPGVANGFAHDSALNARLTMTTALIMGAIVTVLTLVFASRRLSEFSLKGDAV